MTVLIWSRSITVSTSGFHPDNAGSTPAEITISQSEPESGSFFVVNNGEEWKAILLLLSFALETKEGKQRNYYRVASQNYNISRGSLI